jgi:predicted nucleic acid-binding protein
MILVDTSVWVDHFRGRNQSLTPHLIAGEVLTHPFVIGELACCHIKNRAEVISLLKKLPQAAVASDDEVLGVIEAHRLMGRGLGWIDVHLLASAALTATVLWTADRRLNLAAAALNVAFHS